MKRILTIMAIAALSLSACFAQSNARRITEKDLANLSRANIARTIQHQVVVNPVATQAPAPKNITSFPWTEDFEGGSQPAGFVFVDADNDGFNWDATYLYGEGYGHNGSNGIIGSASFDNGNGAALTPDNWMILPAFDIPANGTDFTLRWYEKGQDPNYCEEYYSVYISTSGSSVSDFTTAVLTSTTTSGWVKKSVSLASYAGSTIYIAFRHHNVTDMFFLDIDDIRVGGPEPPELTLAGPTTVVLGDDATYTATTDVASVNWYVDGTQESTTALSLTYTFGTDGPHTVVAEATNVAGSTFDTLNINVVDCGNGIDVFPYSEEFEDEVPCWYFASADTTNDELTGISQEEAHSGLSSYALSSYSTADDYNQFLITPEISLPTNGDYMVTFWYMGESAADAFRVRLSFNGHDTADFTTTVADFPTVNTSWTRVAFRIPDSTKHVAINYYGDYVYYLYIDDFTIEETGAPMGELTGPATIGTGQDATFVADICLADTIAWFVDGDPVVNTGNTLTTVFNAPGNHTVSIEATNNYGTIADTLVVDVFNCNGTTLPYTPDFSEGLRCWMSRSDADEGLGWFASVDMFESEPVGQVLSMSANFIWGMFYMEANVDNWLISPSIEMPANDSATFDLCWKVMTYTSDYPSDHYAAYVIAEDGTETMLHQETLGVHNNSFAQRVASIPAGISGNFKVAFRHYDSEGGYVLILDDIKIVPSGTVTGIDPVETSVAIYPNPASQMLNVKAEGLQKVEMLDMAGRTVLTTSASHISLNGIAAGMYMVRVTTAEGIHTEKVMVK